MKKKLLALLLTLMLALSLTACGGKDTTTTQDAADAETVFTFLVTGPDGAETSFEIHTTAATVGEALLAEGLIDGDDGEYGLYVTSVNGITADWDVDQSYWAFYIDGEYAMTGVDSTEITAGATYSFVYTTYVEESTETSDVTVLGEGETSFFFTVVDIEGNETYYEIYTNAATVGEALLALELIDGDESEYGLYVKVVNGITADWDVDQTYWAFYIDGEYAMTGVDATEITAGATYSFVQTQG